MSNQLELQKLFNIMLPWTLSHHHATRAFSQLAVHTLLEELKIPVKNPHPEAGSPSSDIPDQLSSFFNKNKDMQRLISTLGGGVRAFSSKELGTPGSVFVTGINLAGCADEEISFEGAPNSLLQTLRDYLSSKRARVRDTTRAQIVAKEAGSLLLPTSKAKMPIWIDLMGDYQRKVVPGISSRGRGTDVSQMFQGLALEVPYPWGFLPDCRSCGSDCPQWPTVSNCTASGQDLIVVASLVDKVPNLAGLARTCEVFGSSRLVLADARVTKDHQFTSISMTSEQWLSIDEVHPAALLPWLEARRAEGYTLVGVEQTSESIILAEFEFPSKCVLILGREKEGIPADILLVLDATVEIPQLGLVRSLNVHVSGAVAVYEYSRQIHDWGRSRIQYSG